MKNQIYHNYPDKCVSKKELRTVWFPMSVATLERRIKEIRELKKFKDVLLVCGGKIFVNVQGFYQFLRYKEKMRFK